MKPNIKHVICSTKLPVITPESLLQDIMTLSDLSTLRQHLRAMADAYVLSDDEGTYRKPVYCSYIELDNFLVNVESLSKVQPKERRIA
jgi:hypothetical protein